MPTTTVGTSTFSSSNNAALTSANFAVAAGDLLVAFAIVTGQAGGGTFTDNEAGSTGWDQVTTVLKNTSADTLVVAVKRNFEAANSSSRTVTFTPAGSPTSSGVGMSVYRIAGMARKGIDAVRSVGGTRQVGTQANAAGGGTPAASVLAAVLTGNVTLGGVATGSSGLTVTAPASWTKDVDSSYSTPTTGLETVHRDSGFTGTTITWGSTCPSAFCTAILELDSSSPIGEDDNWVLPQASPVPWASPAVLAASLVGGCDEVWAPQYAGGGDGVYTTVTLEGKYQTPWVFAHEEPFVPAAQAPALDEDTYLLPQPWATPAPPQPVVHEESLAPLANFPLEHSEPWTPLVQSVPWTPVAFSYDEVSTALANFALEQEEAPASRGQTAAWAPRVFADDDQFPAAVAPAFVPDEDYWATPAPPWPAAGWQYRQPDWGADDAAPAPTLWYIRHTRQLIGGGLLP